MLLLKCLFISEKKADYGIYVDDIFYFITLAIQAKAFLNKIQVHKGWNEKKVEIQLKYSLTFKS